MILFKQALGGLIRKDHVGWIRTGRKWKEGHVLGNFLEKETNKMVITVGMERRGTVGVWRGGGESEAKEIFICFENSSIISRCRQERQI